VDRAVLALIIASLGLWPPRAEGQRLTLERITHQQTLDNGLKVIVVENHAVPLATVEVAVRNGAMTQADDEQGVPHLFEHMLFRGYRGAADRGFRQEVAEMNAGYNGTTSDETVTYYLTLPSRNVDDAVRVLSGLVREPRFENAALQTERFVVFGEFQRRLSDPQFLLSREVDKLLWGSAFPRKNTIGEEISLLSVTPQRLEQIFRRYYVPNNSALIVTGDVSASQVFEFAHKHFRGWKKAPDPFVANPVPPMPALDTSRAIVLNADVRDITIEIAWRGPSVRDNLDATYAADVLDDLVNDQESSFQQRLVDSGLFQSAGMSYRTLANVGPLIFRGVTTFDRLAGALTALTTEFTLMRSADYFLPHEIEVAKKRRAVETVFELERGAGLAHSLANWWSVAGLDYFLGYGDNLSARSLGDIHAFVDTYITGRPFVIGALVPAKFGTATSEMLAQYLTLASER